AGAPRRNLLGGVVLLAEAEVDKGGGDRDRREGALLAVRGAHRHAVRLEELGDLGGGPRLVAELHGGPDGRREDGQEALEELPAVDERRGELEQDDAEPVA